MTYCPKCGLKLEEDFHYCPQCGYDLSQIDSLQDTIKIKGPLTDSNNMAPANDSHVHLNHYDDDDPDLTRTEYPEEDGLFLEDDPTDSPNSRSHRHTHYAPDKQSIIRLGKLNIAMFLAAMVTILGIILPNFLNLTPLLEKIDTLSAYGYDTSTWTRLVNNHTSLQDLILNYQNLAQLYHGIQEFLGYTVQVQSLPFVRPITQGLLLIPILFMPLAIFRHRLARKLNLFLALAEVVLTLGLAYFFYPVFQNLNLSLGIAAYLFFAGLIAMLVLASIRLFSQG